MRIGYLSLKERQEGEYVQHMAKAAAKQGIEFVQFTPFNIQPTTELILGWKYIPSKDEWEKTTFEMPQFIYDRCFYSPSTKSKQARPIVEWLKNKKDVTFLGYGLPNKWETYQALVTDNALKPYLPKTKKLLHLAVFFEELRKTRKLVLKPMNGSRGINIFFVTLNAYSITVVTQKFNEIDEQQFKNREEFFEWLHPLVDSRNYIYQPYLNLTTEQNMPQDLRVLLQKNEEGNWHVAGKGIRVGQKDSVISNLSGGSSIIPFEEWIKQYSQQSALVLQDEIDTISSTLPITLEKHFPPLFEIGLDLGIDAHQAVWILDINSKPGRKVVLKTDLANQDKVYSAPIKYCKYLLTQSKNERSEIS
ncbi:YheC/YheD family endospore coat-associated protein [Gottfriedia endophytica]|nr:YheC/YheD family protein [Gottfriedia endophytica]